MPKVSVIVPCWNLGAFLDEAVASVAAQTLRDHEVLIVDDGSTDERTLEVLSRCSRVLRVPHGGVARARNHGAAQARGDYLMFLDADDRLRPGCLQACADALDQDASLSFVSFWVELFGDETWRWQPAACDLTALLGECTVATAALVRREAFVTAGGFDAALELGHEDWDFWLTLVERGHRGRILPEVLFDYRRRPGSRSATADTDEVYLTLFHERVARHDASYREHFGELLAQKEAQLSALLARAAAWSQPDDLSLELERVEVARLQRRLR